MPTYDYKCSSCDNEFEEFQSMTAEPRAKCPKCGKKSKRMFSPGTGIIFKGAGFYVNDYKKNKCDSSSSDNKASSDKKSCSTCPASSTK